jgi:hypothetical protein
MIWKRWKVAVENMKHGRDGVKWQLSISTFRKKVVGISAVTAFIFSPAFWCKLLCSFYYLLLEGKKAIEPWFTAKAFEGITSAHFAEGCGGCGFFGSARGQFPWPIIPELDGEREKSASIRQKSHVCTLSLFFFLPDRRKWTRDAASRKVY